MMNRPTDHNTSSSSSSTTTTTTTANDPARNGYQAEGRIANNDNDVVGVVSRTSSINLISSSSSLSSSIIVSRASSFNNNESVSSGQVVRNIIDDRATPIPTTGTATASITQDHHHSVPPPTNNNNRRPFVSTNTSVRSNRTVRPMIIEPTPPPRRTQIIVPTMPFGKAPPISFSSTKSSTVPLAVAKVPHAASSSLPTAASLTNVLPVPSFIPTKDPTASSSSSSQLHLSSSLSSSSQQLPPRPLSAYNLFFRMERKYLLHQLETSNDGTNIGKIPTKVYTMEEVTQFALEQRQYDTDHHQEAEPPKKRKHCKTHGKISFTSLARHVASRWKTMPNEQRRIFQYCYQYEMDYYRTVVATQVVNVSADYSSSQAPSKDQNQEEDLNNSCSSGFEVPSSLLSSSMSSVVPGSSSITMTTQRNDNHTNNNKIGWMNTTCLDGVTSNGTTTPMSSKKMTIITPSIEKQMTNALHTSTTSSSTKVPKHIMTMSSTKVLPMIEPFVGNAHTYAPRIKQFGINPYPVQVPKSKLLSSFPKQGLPQKSGMINYYYPTSALGCSNSMMTGTAGVAPTWAAVDPLSSTYCGNCGCYYCEGTSCDNDVCHLSNLSPMIPKVPPLPISSSTTTATFRPPRRPPKKNFCNLYPNTSNNISSNGFVHGGGCTTSSSSMMIGNLTYEYDDNSFVNLDYGSNIDTSNHTSNKTSMVPWNNGMITRPIKLPPPSSKCSTTKEVVDGGANSLLLNKHSCNTTMKCNNSCTCSGRDNDFIQRPGVGQFSSNINRADIEHEEHDDEEEKKLFEYRKYLQQRKQKWKNRIEQLHKKIQYQQYQLQQYYNYSQQQQEHEEHQFQMEQQHQYQNESKYYVHNHHHSNSNNRNNDMADNGIELNDDSGTMMMIMGDNEDIMMDPSNFIDPFE